MPSTDKPLLALALSGGAARCIAQIGVIQALEDEGIRIDAVAGTSAGAVVGALYLDGMPPDEMARLAAKTTWASIFRPGFSMKGLVSPAGIYGFLKRHLKAGDIADLKRPFAAVCADLQTGEKVVLTEGPLARAVQASCSLPVVFTPTRFEGRLLIDGGYVSQIPVLAAREELGAKVVVAVDANYRSAPAPPKTGSMIGISIHLAQMFARKNADQELPYADAVINVDIDGIGLLDIGRHEELLELGRKAARAKAEAIREALGAVL